MRTNDTPVAYTRYMTGFESRRSVQYRDGVITSGWFKAPETGNYRFYISCDDACELLLDENTPFDKSNPTEPVLDRKANRNWASEWRNYLVPPPVDSDTQQISDWISL